MSGTRFYFNLALFGATSSIADMRMLAEQAEHAISNAIANAQVVESEYEDEDTDEHGNVYHYTQKVYSCGSCTGFDAIEAKMEYEHLIAQLIRRSAYLTIFGIFEYHMSVCKDIILRDVGYDKKIQNGIVEGTEELLKKALGCKNAPDLKHLSVIRNFFAHSDGKYYEYTEVKSRIGKKTDSEKKKKRGFEQATKDFSGLSLNPFSSIIIDETFLPEAIDVLESFATKLSDAVTHHANNKQPTTSNIQWGQRLMKKYKSLRLNIRWPFS